MQTAAKAWNKSGVDIRLKRAKKKSEAQLRILVKKFPGSPNSGNVGYATQGYTTKDVYVSDPFTGRLSRRGNTMWINSKIRNRYAAASVVAHEFGHVLGIHHVSKGCALMSTALWPYTQDNDPRTPRGCARPPYWHWRCRLVERDDAKGVAKLYGGEIAQRRAVCPQVADGLAPPGGLKVFQGPEAAHNGYYEFDATPAAGSTKGERFIFAFYRNQCPASGGPPEDWWFLSEAPVDFTSKAKYPPGQYCLAVWSHGNDGFLSKRAATRVFQHKILPPNPPRDVVVENDEEAGGVALNWLPGLRAVEVRVMRGPASACPTTPEEGEEISSGFYDYDELEEQTPPDVYFPEPGAYCYSFFSISAYGDHSAPVTVQHTAD